MPWTKPAPGYEPTNASDPYAATFPAIKQTRPHTIHVRVSDAGLDAIDRIAQDEGRSRSDMARILLAEAVAARAKQARR